LWWIKQTRQQILR